LSNTAGFELPARMLLAFRASVDDAHAELALQGHPAVQPLHAFVLRAIGTTATTAGELATRLAISKQAAAKTIALLERHGYVRRAPDPGDARRKLVMLTGKGVDCLARASRIFDDQRAHWARELGTERLAALEDGLAAMSGGWRPVPSARSARARGRSA
jgi:DNA-binding MarR family transcriptional regulator